MFTFTNQSVKDGIFEKAESYMTEDIQNFVPSEEETVFVNGTIKQKQ